MDIKSNLPEVFPIEKQENSNSAASTLKYFVASVKVFFLYCTASNLLPTHFTNYITEMLNYYCY